MLSERAKKLKPSPTLALASKAKELKAEGRDVISLSVGEPDWDTFQPIKDAGIQAIKEGNTKYTPANGLPQLREAVARQTNKDFGVSYSVDQVTVSSGAKFVIFSALQALLDPGDEVIVPAPYWVSYPTMVELAGGKPVVVKCPEASEFKLTASQLSESITQKTKVLLLNSPSNPTGQVYSNQEWKEIAQVLQENPHVFVLSDDIYNRLVFGGQDVAPHLLQAEPELMSRVLTVNGASKTYSMTGWRIGWALGPKELIQAMNKFQSQSVSCAAGFSQMAAHTAVTEAESLVKDSVKVLEERRDFVVEGVGRLEGLALHPPKGTFYAWTKMEDCIGKQFQGTKIESSRDFARILLETQNVVVVPGIEFGLEGYVRMSYAINQERMGEALDRIGNFLSELS